MAEKRPEARGIGRITTGIQLGTSVAKTTEFIREHLSRRRDDPTRPAELAEPKLNIHLCMFLEANARNRFPMACFHHEMHQTGKRRVDVSVSPPEMTVIEARPYSIYDPFLVLEGKRLPAPVPEREREYVTGGDRRDGGIQRFKLGLHGAELGFAVMIGYVQQRSARHWHKEINAWISALASGESNDVCLWNTNERLGYLNEDKVKRTASCNSAHSRSGEVVSESIQIQHLFVEMSGGPEMISGSKTSVPDRKPPPK